MIRLRAVGEAVMAQFRIFGKAARPRTSRVKVFQDDRKMPLAQKEPILVSRGDVSGIGGGNSCPGPRLQLPAGTSVPTKETT